MQDVEGTMSVSKEDLSLKMWQLQEAVQRLRTNVRTVHDTKCRRFSNVWRKVTPWLTPIQPLQQAADAMHIMLVYNSTCSALAALLQPF